MLTIEEIKNVSFRKANFSGYRPEDVDAFIDEIIETVEHTEKEKIELIRKLDILASKIEQYRADEETVRNALLSTQKITDSTIKEANEKAAIIIKNAKIKANEMISKAQQAVENEKKKYINIEAETSQLRKEIVLLYKKHLKLVDEMPTDADVKQKQQDLDNRYPYEPANVSDPSLHEDEDIKIAPQKQSANSIDNETNTDEKSQSKFDSLKFGDNYDVDQEK